MITAICLGMSWAGGMWRVALPKVFMCAVSGVGSSRHQLGFFGCDHLVDIGDVFVGEFLDLLLRSPLLVLGYGLAFQQLFERMIGVAAGVAHRDLGIFALVLDHLDQIAAALLGERGHRYPDHVPLRSRIQAKIGLADGLLDRAEHLFFPGGYPEGAGARQAY